MKGRGETRGRRVTTDPRISRRRRAIARSRRRKLAASVASVAIVVGLVWLAFFSPLLVVRRVQVVGSRHVSSSDVAEVARLGSDDNLLILSTSEVARKVESLPWVRRARVTRLLPSTVRVKVIERRPAVVLATARERWTLDRAGRVLAVGPAAGGLPILGGVEARGIKPGDILDSGSIHAALKAWRSLPGWLRAEIVGVFAPSVQRIAFSLRDDTIVRYGAAEEMAAKNSVLRAVLARLKAQGTAAEYVDVRVPASPAVAPVAPAGVAPPGVPAG